MPLFFFPQNHEKSMCQLKLEQSAVKKTFKCSTLNSKTKMDLVHNARMQAAPLKS